MMIPRGGIRRGKGRKSSVYRLCSRAIDSTRILLDTVKTPIFPIEMPIGQSKARVNATHLVVRFPLSLSLIQRSFVAGSASHRCSEVSAIFNRTREPFSGTAHERDSSPRFAEKRAPRVTLPTCGSADARSTTEERAAVRRSGAPTRTSSAGVGRTGRGLRCDGSRARKRSDTMTHRWQWNI